MFFMRLNLVVIAALATLISTVVGPPQVDQQIEFFRMHLRRYNEQDGCRDKPWDVEDGCPWPFDDSLAKQNCRNARNAFLSLTDEEKDRICPEAQQAKCRKCGKVRYGCTFMCRPTLSEVNAAAFANRPLSQRLKCKHLVNIVAQINRPMNP
nr:PREDICTED: uncharacterized protein LOC109031954 [Bemisia tabaci]